MRNDRPWYNEHKDEFARKVVEPLQELVKAMTPAMREIDSLFRACAEGGQNDFPCLSRYPLHP